MDEVAARLRGVQQTIRACEDRYGRASGAVSLIAVSKRQPVAAVTAACAAGQRAFGENFLQEALDKIDVLAPYRPQWHFIGAIQSNKTRAIAAHFDWVHTVDREKIAQRLSAQRPPSLAPLNVCIQVNISGENTKHGIAPGAFVALVEAIASLPRLKLRGVMALPAPVDDMTAQRHAFAAVAALAATSPVALDSLSIGTSADFEAAIAEGATMVRIGTAVFGPRDLRA